jgi:Carboxypeptidase regulatory-like domain
MSTMRAISGRGLSALLCSLLLVYQPAYGFPGATPRDDANSAHGGPSSAPTSIAVAKLTGSADRNGQALINGSVISSGDALETHMNSALLLASAPQERLWLGPNTSAKVTKEAGTVAVALERGTVSFESRGHIQISLESHDGLTLRSRSDSAVRAQLSFIDHQQAQVRVQEGSLELVQGDHAVLLRPNQSSSLSASGGRNPAESRTKSSGQDPASQSEPGSIDGTVVNAGLFAVPDAKVTLSDAAGKVFTTQSDQVGKFSFTNLNPGTYTLHVEKTGFDTYSLSNVVVRSGNESSLYVQLAGGGAKKSGAGGNSILLWVIIGGAAAGGIGAYLGTRGSKSTTSPSSTESVE